MEHNFVGAGSEFIKLINVNNFDDIASSLFQYQYQNNQIYKQFTNALHIRPESVKNIIDIPFLPVSFFKTHKIITGNKFPQLYFESSGTTGAIPSRHFIADIFLYEASLIKGFKQFYGLPSEYAILALLPSYLERQNASLVHMAKVLMKESGNDANGFYLNEWAQLHKTILDLEAKDQKILLLGVTFALIDFATAFPMTLKNTIVMETGGMKGRREEWTRAQVHNFLKQQWKINEVHSEYGMTELLSQAYAKANGLFYPTETMCVFIRDLNDPLEIKRSGSGCLNIIDLANIHSCAFLATEDIGNLYEDGSFEVLGRMDHAALRGCSLMTM